MFQICFILKVNHHSYIIYFRCCEFLDYAEGINTKIKSIACIQPEIMRVIWEYVWPWFSRSTVEESWQMSVFLRFPTSDIFKSTARMILYHVYNPWFSRSPGEVESRILITARSVSSNTMKSTCRSSLDGAEVSASGWRSGGPRFKSRPRQISQSWSSYQLNQLGSKAASDLTLKTVDTCGVSNTCTLLFTF